ncbi:MAG: hypothetical protein IT369_24460 [Candidatus Latescibacteria bacterium]|nr:hypothetical protein [Candidatus Latescibacterota bacterium]
MLIATNNQVHALVEGHEGAPPALVFSSSESITALEEGWQVSAVAAGGEIALLEGRQVRWLAAGIAEPIESLLLVGEEPLRLLVGTEGPHLYRLADEGRPACRLESFAELECRHKWHTPWGGPPAVRSLARRGDWLYADIHVGSIVRSPDRGCSWEPVQPGINEDVHQVATSAVLEERLYANTAEAVYISEDRGRSWIHRDQGLATQYGRAIAVHPRDPDCLLASVSRGPGEEVEGRLYRSDDAGRTWTQVREGFPEITRANIDTFQVIFSTGGTAWAAVEDTLYRSADRGVNWERVWQAPEPIRLLSCACAD